MSYSGEIIIISCDETELDINGTFFYIKFWSVHEN